MKPKLYETKINDVGLVIQYSMDADEYGPFCNLIKITANDSEIDIMDILDDFVKIEIEGAIEKQEKTWRIK